MAAPASGGRAIGDRVRSAPVGFRRFKSKIENLKTIRLRLHQAVLNLQFTEQNTSSLTGRAPGMRIIPTINRLEIRKRESLNPIDCTNYLQEVLSDRGLKLLA